MSITSDGEDKNIGKPIRVLCVFSRLNRGGSESMCMELYRHIDREKVQFDFVKHASVTCAFEKEICALGGRIFEAPRYRLYNHLSYLRWWYKHLKVHQEHRIIHGHFFTISYVYFRIAKLMNRITIAHAHALGPRVIPNIISFKLKTWLCRRIKKYSDHAFACSKSAGDWMFPQMEYMVLRNAIDIKKFTFSQVIREAVRNEFNIDNCLVIGTVGNIAQVKNPYGILEIVKACKARRPDLRFLWVGYGGELGARIKKQIEQEGLTDYIIMTGARPDVDRLLQAMDAFVLPSFAEGLAIATIEAQSTGLPCFISNFVPDDAVVTSHCQKLSLDDYNLWADELLKVDPALRADCSATVGAGGYDINTTVKFLQDFYLRL